MTYCGEYAPYLSHIVAELTSCHMPMLLPLMIYYKIRLSSTVISTPDIIPVSSLLKAFISDPDPGVEAWKDSRPDPFSPSIMTTAVPIAFLYEPLLTMTAFPCFIHSASWSMSLMFTICSKQSSAVVLCCINVTKFGGHCIAFGVMGPVPVQIHESRHQNTIATSMA